MIDFSFHYKDISSVQILLKNNLNAEFENSAKISGLVSYIYYPTQRDFMMFGHVELELEGKSYTYGTEHKNIERMIDYTVQKEGYPFFRTPFTATPAQLKKLGSLVNNDLFFISSCSMDACRLLSQVGIISIPWPLTVSPLLSASSLALAKKLSSKKFEKITFYSKNSKEQNLVAMAPGVVFELFLNAMFIYFTVNFMIRIYNRNFPT